MAQIKKKFLENNAVDQSKFRLDNNAALRARNNANDADLNLIRVTTSDKAQILLELDMNGQAISNVGLVDGRDISADGAALDAHLNGGANKHDASEVDYERADGSKKNIDAASDDVESALSDLDDAIGALDATPTNYTPADPAIVADHLAAIDSVLASNDNKTVKVSSNDTTPGFLEDKIVSANSILSVATLNDGGNEDLQLTVNQGNIDHGSIAGLGDDDHTQYILVNGSRAFSGDQSIGGFKLTNLADPSAAQDAATKAYVDDVIVPEYATDADAPSANQGLYGENSSSASKFILGYGNAANVPQYGTEFATSTDSLVILNTNDSGTANNAQAAIIMQTKEAAGTLRSGRIYIRSGIGEGQTSGITGGVFFESGKRDAASSGTGRTGNLTIGSGEDQGTGSGATGNNTLYTGNKTNASSTGNTGRTGLYTGDHAGTGDTGNIEIGTGDQTNVGNSGNIIIGTGSVVSGTKGSVSITGNGITLDSDAGDISAASNKIINLADGSAANDAVNKGQLDLKANDADVIKKDGSVTYTANQPMGGFKLTGLADPSAAQDSATKAYVDAVAEGLKPKAAVRAASTANIDIATDLENGDSLDGVTLATGDRVLLKDQNDDEDNGIYIVAASGAASRSSDFDSLSPIDEINGAMVAVQEGTANAGKVFVQTGDVATLGTDPINFVFFNSNASLVGGDGITVSGSNISVDHDGEGLQFVANQLALELDGSTLSKSSSGLKVADLGIANAQISNSAAIAYSKLALSNSIVAGDLTSNSVTTAKIANDAVDKDKIAADVAGDGLGQNVDGSLEVNVDDSSIEINADALRVKALGITNAMLAGSIDDSKLNQITTANKVAGSAVELNATGAIENSSGLRVRVDASTVKRNASNNLEALKSHSEKLTLIAGDITNQYVDLAQTAYSAASISLVVIGGLEQEQAVDYTVSLSGGAGGVTRISFAGDLATGGAAELIAGDKLVVKYSYL